MLTPGTYAYVLNETKGAVDVHAGPTKENISTQTDRLVVFNKDTGRFDDAPSYDGAIQTFVKAEEGQYVVLSDPVTAAEGAVRFPKTGGSEPAAELDSGKKVVLPGPTSFALWPGQSAEVIDGHHLTQNEYLLVRVREPRAAQENIGQLVAAPQASEGNGGDEDGADARSLLSASDLTAGRRVVIKGTGTSYFIPPTGIEVVREGGRFVRRAATPGPLEYCVLIDENGTKRFVKGPAVVFPEPTERFSTDEDGNPVFKADDLNVQSGLYIKVTADYEDENGEHKEGDELFLTGGRDEHGPAVPIYYPRAEHSVIQYGDRRKIHAIAIPEGDGRYVLDRTKGSVETVKGPKMFLPDPRRQVIVKRELPERRVKVMYPGNEEAVEVNRTLRSMKRSRSAGGALEALGAVESKSLGDFQNVAYDVASTMPATTPGGERIERGTEYTPPRTITLDNKYEGPPKVSVYSGYAVLVTDKTDGRRVEQGPKNIMLDYDEDLAILTLSSGRPKSSRTKTEVCYLRIVNNAVADSVGVETRDLIDVGIDLSLRVNFEGDDPLAWFNVEDYVALLTDHVRSRLRNLAKRHDIQEFTARATDLIRDSLLGEAEERAGKKGAASTGRPGLSFPENGMRLYDVEVSKVQIRTPDVQALLDRTARSALEGAIQVDAERRRAEQQREIQESQRKVIGYAEETAEAEAAASIAEIERSAAASVRRAHARLADVTAAEEVTAVQRAGGQADADLRLGIERATNEENLRVLGEEAKLFVERTKALEEPLVRALNVFGDRVVVERLVEAIAPAAAAMGVTNADVLERFFAGTALGEVLEPLVRRPLGPGGS